jgi:molecular chaperone GrpE
MAAMRNDNPNADPREERPDDPAAGPDATQEPAAPGGGDLIRELTEKAETYQENWLRAGAELQNLQKRAVRDREMARNLAVRDLVRALLPSFDNLERALLSTETGSFESLLQGVSMVSAEIRRVLLEQGIQIIEPEGGKLDPSRHEAVSSRPDPDADENTILDVLEKGYALGDMVIRPARVLVSQGRTSASRPGRDEEEN